MHDIYLLLILILGTETPSCHSAFPHATPGREVGSAICDRSQSSRNSQHVAGDTQQSTKLPATVEGAQSIGKDVLKIPIRKGQAVAFHRMRLAM